MAKAIQRKVLRNWRTTVGALLGALVFLAGYYNIPVATVGDWGEVVGMIVAAVTGLLASDKGGDE